VLDGVVDCNTRFQTGEDQNKEKANQAHNFAMLGFWKFCCGPVQKKYAF
jgi:hypothetical protein